MGEATEYTGKKEGRGYRIYRLKRMERPHNIRVKKKGEATEYTGKKEGKGHRKYK